MAAVLAHVSGHGRSWVLCASALALAAGAAGVVVVVVVVAVMVVVVLVVVAVEVVVEKRGSLTSRSIISPQQ